MKLQSLLQESTLSSLDISDFTGDLDPKYEKRIKEILGKFSKYKVESSDIDEEMISIHITNGLIDFNFDFTKEEPSSTEPAYVLIEIASMVNTKYVYNAENIKKETDYNAVALTQSFNSEKSLEDKHYASTFKYVEDLLQIADEFEQWYFDLSGEYGKVKLTKTTYNVEDRSTDSTWKWVPICGYFWAGFKGKEPHVEAKVI